MVIVDDCSTDDPTVRMKISRVDAANGEYEFRIAVNRAAIPRFPSECESRLGKKVLNRAIGHGFTIDDGVNPVVVAANAVFWDCPRNLKINGSSSNDDILP